MRKTKQDIHCIFLSILIIADCFVFNIIDVGMSRYASSEELVLKWKSKKKNIGKC